MLKKLLNKLRNRNITYLFIDGSNLYAGQYDLFGPKKFLNFSVFIKNIEKKISVKFDRILFYASYSPNPKKPTKKQKEYLKNEGLFYQNVKQTPRVEFFKGYRSKTTGKEKEVDVKLGVDIVNYAHLANYSNLYFFSGDADFMRALLIAKKLDKEVKIIALENRVPIRFTFNFRTYLFVFSKTKNIKISAGQRVDVLKIKEKSVIQNIS